MIFAIKCILILAFAILCFCLSCTCFGQWIEDKKIIASYNSNPKMYSYKESEAAKARVSSTAYGWASVLFALLFILSTITLFLM